MSQGEERLLETADPSYRYVPKDLEQIFVDSGMADAEVIGRSTLIDPRRITSVAMKEEDNLDRASSLNAVFGLEKLVLRFGRRQTIKKGMSLDDVSWAVGPQFRDVQSLVTTYQVMIDARYDASIMTSKSPFTGNVLHTIIPYNMIRAQFSDGSFGPTSSARRSHMAGGIYVLFMHMTLSSGRTVSEDEIDYMESSLATILSNTLCVKISSLEHSDQGRQH